MAKRIGPNGVIFPDTVSDWDNIKSGHVGLGTQDGDLVLRDSGGTETPFAAPASDGSGTAPVLPGTYADDAAAAAGGVPLYGAYRKASGVVAWRQA